jgi:hypothetical protein
MPVSKCKHGIYLDGCRECFPLPDTIYNFFPKLTNEKITEIWQSNKFEGELYIDYIAFARAIEKAHGIGEEK